MTRPTSPFRPTLGRDLRPDLRWCAGYRVGTPVAEAGGVTSGTEDGCAVYGVGSGTYHFVAKGIGLPPAHKYPIPAPPPQIDRLSDDLSTAQIDEDKWQVLDMGLDSSQPCGIEAKQDGGRLLVSGTTSVDYWSGRRCCQAHSA